jgi:hypothetical protein
MGSRFETFRTSFSSPQEQPSSIGQGVIDKSWTSKKLVNFKGVIDKSWTSKKTSSILKESSINLGRQKNSSIGGHVNARNRSYFLDNKRCHKSRLEKLSTKTELGSNPRQLGAMLTLETDRIFSTNLNAISLGRRNFRQRLN